MKKIIVATFLLFATNVIGQNITLEHTNEGQVLSVIGWANMMPGGFLPGEFRIPKSSTAPMTVKFIAASNGCTTADSFSVSFEKLNDASTVYLVKVSRTTPDHCRAIAREIVISKQVVNEEVFSALSSNNATLLSEPFVQVGIAH